MKQSDIMSLTSTIKLTCGPCKTEHDFTAWKSINVTVDPAKKAELLSGSLLRFTCPQCSWTAQVTYPILYHDMKAKFMVWLVGEQPKIDSYPIDRFGGYQFRFVSSTIELVEKIFIFDAGLDDRAVEAFKMLLMAQLQKSNHKSEPRFAKLTQDQNNQAALDFELVPAELGKGMRVPREVFDSFTKSLKPVLDKDETNKAGWYKIDSAYGAKLMADAGRN